MWSMLDQRFQVKLRPGVLMRDFEARRYERVFHPAESTPGSSRTERCIGGGRTGSSGISSDISSSINCATSGIPRFFFNLVDGFSRLPSSPYQDAECGVFGRLSN
jgi:hypothetical protein